MKYVNEWGSAPPEQIIRSNLDALLREKEGEERPILALDQFEDVFKAPGGRARLWDCLAELANVFDGPAHLLITMREEWLGAWQESEDYLPDALSCLIRLRALSDAEVLRAIKEPTATEGTLTFDPDLANRLSKELRQPSVFGGVSQLVDPGLLQLVCRRLWSLANSRGMKVIPMGLYDELGGADMMLREFVWNELGSAGLKDKEVVDPDRPTPSFSAEDRVLWTGLTRHLIVAHGVKSIVSATQIARSLVFTDLGVTGRAVLEAKLTPASSSYLDQAPEKRGAPPDELVGWIGQVLQAAVDVGIMKRQKVFSEVNGDVPSRQQPYFYELSHDRLGDILQVFKIDFEGWIRVKLAKLVGTVVGAVIVLPVLTFVLLTTTFSAALSALGSILMVAFFTAIYWVAIMVASYIATIIGRLLMHPVYRRLIRGRLRFRRGR